MWDVVSAELHVGWQTCRKHPPHLSLRPKAESKRESAIAPIDDAAQCRRLHPCYPTAT